ncbi:MAG: MdtA/MuxA family multidrug efflux RND transporter periplasmic adaptor subunit [Candidatus Binataceae bacterium]
MPDTETNSPARALRGRGKLWIAAALVAAIAVYAVLDRFGGARDTAAQASAPAKGPVIPVAAAAARLGDLNLYVTALGTVTPFYTVTVKSRVDGQLMKVDFKEGQEVKKGELLAQIDPRPFQVQLTQAEGQLERDRATLENNRILFARDQELFRQNVLARQDLDNQKSLVGQYDGTILADRGTVDNAKLQLTYSRITAPISGRVGLRLVDPGNIVHATDPGGIAVITQLQPISVIFSIPEDDLPRVFAAMKANPHLPVAAYDRDFKQQLAAGTLLTVDNQIDPNTGTVKLKAKFANENDALFPNQFVNAKLLVDTIHNAILVPAAALQRSQRGTFVYVAAPDGTAQMRSVKIAAQRSDLAAISSGVKPGELVVVDGMDKLRNGTRVKVQLAANAAAQSGAP